MPGSGDDYSIGGVTMQFAGQVDGRHGYFIVDGNEAQALHPGDLCQPGIYTGG